MYVNVIRRELVELFDFNFAFCNSSRNELVSVGRVKWARILSRILSLNGRMQGNQNKVELVWAWPHFESKDRRGRWEAKAKENARGTFSARQNTEGKIRTINTYQFSKMRIRFAAINTRRHTHTGRPAKPKCESFAFISDKRRGGEFIYIPNEWFTREEGAAEFWKYERNALSHWAIERNPFR